MLLVHGEIFAQYMLLFWPRNYWAHIVALWLVPAAPLLALRFFPAAGFGLIFVFVASGAALFSAVCGPLAHFLPVVLVAPSFPSVAFLWVAAGVAWAWVGLPCCPLRVFCGFLPCGFFSLCLGPGGCVPLWLVAVCVCW